MLKFRALYLFPILLAACQAAAISSPPVRTTPAPQADVVTSPPAPTLIPVVTSIQTPTALPKQALPPTTSPVTPTITPTPTLLAGPAPTLPAVPRRFISHGSRDKPLVALTFDLCQKPELPSWFDKKIYQALVDSNTRATFFMGGDWMRTHIAETRLLAANPLFELGNHSYTHPDLPDLNSYQIGREVLKTQDMMYRITGRQPRIFRLPSGKYNDLVLDTVAQEGLYIIQWDADTADPVPDNNAENILRLVKERVQNGSIVLMHANGRGWHTGEALPGMIAYLRAQGYCLVTVPQLIGLDPVPADCEQ